MFDFLPLGGCVHLSTGRISKHSIFRNFYIWVRDGAESVMMPHLSGDQPVQQFRTHPELDNTPVVI
ncbi:hypothetical protein H6F88_02395 [Oculatella sp. FACHB-28]|uniref:hypothetical protein n=1 Tax=Cyanophyceae TaxID=3028117 RepID=UPI001687D88B|nr:MULTISPECIES: hypothetical protein [Cyanophyceae]MBD1995925.1 hypothetical protein [Leptolyngbya sp. FACHB-541]MBD2054879.1 hypothetical protein [Oculatella sp. FACHB-28]